MGWFDKFRVKMNEETILRSEERPDPVFLGDFLVFNLLKPFPKFNIEEERLDELTLNLPENIRDLAKGWTMIYLAWLYKVYAFTKYGMEFTNRLLLEVREKLQKATNYEINGLWPILEYWFKNLDSATDNIGTQIDDVEVPYEVFAALAFIVLDSDSPYYKNPHPEPNTIGFDVGFILASVAQESKQVIQGLVDIGGPIEEILSKTTLFCEYCGSTYDLEDYNQDALKWLCSNCGKELRR